MSTIALKIGSLLVRTLAKPIANSIKARAKHHGPFRQSCIAVAQVLHSTDVRLRSGLMGEAGKARVRPLNDAKAIEMGANFLSEAFLFSVAAGAVIFESVRSSRKATSRHETVSDDIAELKAEIEQLKIAIAKISPDLGIKDAPGAKEKHGQDLAGAKPAEHQNVIVIPTQNQHVSLPSQPSRSLSVIKSTEPLVKRARDFVDSAYSQMTSLFK